MLQGSAKIKSLVSSNYIYASVLYYFGIEFYRVSNHTLEEVCRKQGLKIEHVIAKLEQAAKISKKNELREMINFPINLIIQYLKHAHSIFIKKDLPYIANLIENISPEYREHQALIDDLKLVFPLFAEDFIHHIYQEEDSLFSYIQVILAAKEQGYLNPDQYMKMEKYSLQHFAMEHAEHDDEMHGVSKILKQYTLSRSAPLHLQVIFSELKDFQEKLRIHALVENHILFPKALELENQIVKDYKEVIKYN